MMSSAEISAIQNDRRNERQRWHWDRFSTVGRWWGLAHLPVMKEDLGAFCTMNIERETIGVGRIFGIFRNQQMVMAIASAWGKASSLSMKISNWVPKMIQITSIGLCSKMSTSFMPRVNKTSLDWVTYLLFQLHPHQTRVEPLSLEAQSGGIRNKNSSSQPNHGVQWSWQFSPWLKVTRILSQAWRITVPQPQIDSTSFEMVI